MSTLRYVYGIVPANAAGAVDPAEIEGIDGARVRAIVDGALAAAYSEVDGVEYGEAVLNERVRDLDWLAPRAAAHQSVNARLLELAGVVLPLSFGALYRDEPPKAIASLFDDPRWVRNLDACRGRYLEMASGIHVS